MCKLLTVSEASNPSKSGNGNMRHIPIHAEDGGGGSCWCAGCSVSLLSDQPSHLPSVERIRKAPWTTLQSQNHGLGCIKQKCCNFSQLLNYLCFRKCHNSKWRGLVISSFITSTGFEMSSTGSHHIIEKFNCPPFKDPLQSITISQNRFNFERNYVA